MYLPGRLCPRKWLCSRLEIQSPAHSWNGESLGGWDSPLFSPESWTSKGSHTQNLGGSGYSLQLFLESGPENLAWPLYSDCVQWVRGWGSLRLESLTNGARRAACLLKCSLLHPLATYFSFVYKLVLPFNFYLFLVASKTVPEDKGLFVNHHPVGFWKGKLGGENVMFCGLFVVQKEFFRCRKSHTT